MDDQQTNAGSTYCTACGEQERVHCPECYACPDDHAYYCSREQA